MSTYKNDSPDHLDRAIQSVWEDQYEKPDEIILVVDGPVSKRTKKILDKYRTVIGNNFKIVYQEKNLGLGATLNNGVEYCNCEFIARMDADDISLPNRFFLQKRFLKENPDIAVLGGSIKEFDEDGNQYCRKFPADTEEIKNEIPKGSPFAHPAVMIKREIFKDVAYTETTSKSIDKIVVGNEDIALWFEIIKRGYKVANLDQSILKYRKNHSFFDRRSKNKSFSEFKIYWEGTLALHGFSYRLIFPLLRLASRHMPRVINKFLYSQRSLVFKSS
ncbi:glycosyltransferase [Gracilimonas sp. BCB1]|uniref:glycosyltransferase n=1 Tax=Gracilimonas sp. BCB1 TaxID=3152362 RepID=UPI0032D95D4A